MVPPVKFSITTSACLMMPSATAAALGFLMSMVTLCLSRLMSWKV